MEKTQRLRVVLIVTVLGAAALVLNIVRGRPQGAAHAIEVAGPVESEGAPDTESIEVDAAMQQARTETHASAPDSAQPAPASEEQTPPIEPQAAARLIVHLETTDGLLVPMARLSLRGESEELSLTEATPGMYVVESTAGFSGALQVADLPSGMLPPRHLRARYGPEPLTLQPGDNEVTLQVVRGARVHGRVFGADGGDLRGTHVRFDELRAPDPSAFLGSIYASAYDSGWYELTLDPGNWIVMPQPDWPTGEPLPDPTYVHPPAPDLTGCLAVPMLLTLTPGEVRRVDVGWRLGTATLTIEVVDGRGAAFEDAFVLVSHAGLNDLDGVSGPELNLGLAASVCSGRTDSNGHLRAEGLAAGRYTFVVEPEGYSAFAAPGTARIGRPPMPARVDVPSTGTHVRCVVHRAHPIEIEGRLSVPDSALELRPKVEAILGPQPWRAQDRARTVAVGTDGTFRFWVDRSEGQLTVLVSTRDTTEAFPLSWDPEGEFSAPLPVSIAIGPKTGAERR